MRVPITALALLLLVSMGARAQTAAPPPVQVIETATLEDPDLRESSGVIASSRIPGVLFTLNDSGNPPEIFATDSSGRALGRFTIPQVRNVDWEALSRGPCPAGSCLFIGDIGDNRERRRQVVIYRIREPARMAAGPTPLDLDSAAFRYPDRPHDAEALWVDAQGTMYVVTKGRRGPVALYRVAATSFKTHGVATADLLQRLPIEPEAWMGRLVTDAALSPDGRRVAVRTYTELYLFPVTSAGGLGTPGVCSLAGLEPQGEGVAWLDDRRLVLTSESGRGRHAAPIHVVHCNA